MSSIVISNLHGYAVPGGPVEISRHNLYCGSKLSVKHTAIILFCYLCVLWVCKRDSPSLCLCFCLPHTLRRVCCARLDFSLFLAALGGNIHPSSASPHIKPSSIVNQTLWKTVCKYMDLLMSPKLTVTWSSLFLCWGSSPGVLGSLT